MRYIKIVILLFFITLFFSCSSKRLVFRKDGQSYEEGKEIVLTYKDLRKWYDKKDYNNINEALYPILNMKKMKDYFVHFLFIESSYKLDRLSDINKFYNNSDMKYFYKGLIEFEKGNYGNAAKYLLLDKSNKPIVNYFIGTSYLYKEKIALALGNLILSKNWEDTPWPYLNLASIYQIKGKNDKALDYLEKALDNSYDFETNLAIDVLAKKTELYFNQRNYDEALYYAKQIFVKDKQKAIYLADPGDILLGAGKKQKALVFWKKVLNDPGISIDIVKLINKKIEVLDLIKK